MIYITVHNGTAQYFTSEEKSNEFLKAIRGTKITRMFKSMDSAIDYMDDQFPTMKLKVGKIPKSVIKTEPPAETETQAAVSAEGVSMDGLLVQPSETNIAIAKTYKSIGQLWHNVPSTIETIIVWREKMKLANEKLAELFLKKN